MVCELSSVPGYWTLCYRTPLLPREPPMETCWAERRRRSGTPLGCDRLSEVRERLAFAGCAAPREVRSLCSWGLPARCGE